MEHYMRALARKGKLTIVERANGKAIVAIQASGSVVTLEHASKDQLIRELYQIVRNWPDIEEEAYAHRG
jgi:hypothetical protein